MHDHSDRSADPMAIPVSAGVPPIVVVSGLVGLVLIGAILALVFTNASFGHAWPSTSSLTLNLSNNTKGATTK